MFTGAHRMSIGRLKRVSTNYINAIRLYMTTNDIRRSFIKFFESHGHVNVPSSSLLASSNDPSLIFTNAGMNQFKSLFLGNSDNKWTGLERVVSCQKCIRAGGKHNDLEDVGRDLHHLSFFEMLGNWSFNGAYSKEQAYKMAWHFLTDVLEIDRDRLYVSYFGGSSKFNITPDETSKRIWLKIGLNESHILPFVNENFWEMGTTGPCGPCIEIHYDRVCGRKDAGRFVNVDSSIVELWNIVLISHMRTSNGDLHPLPNNHIDTGMGLERLSSIVQNVPSNYDVDVFTPIMRHISLMSRVGNYEGRVGSKDIDGRDASYRIIADHLRAVVMALSDGVQLSAVDAGFLTRKMLRQSFWHSVVRLGFDRFACSELIPVVIDTLKEAYPELKSYEENITESVVEEERQYWDVIDRGKSIFEQMRLNMPAGATVFTGENAFILHDTHGVSLEITQDLCREHGFIVDVERYHKLKEEAKVLSRSKSNLRNVSHIDVTELTGHSDIAKYDYILDKHKSYVFPHLISKVIGVFVNNQRTHSLSSMGSVVLENCQFYAEEGGQKCDQGFLEIDEKPIFEVKTVEKLNGISILHGNVIDDNKISEGSVVKQKIDVRRRMALMRAHSATHLLNWALRRVGAGQRQCGSSVDEDSLRFDYVTDDCAGEDDVVGNVESLIMDVISQGRPVVMEHMPLQIAALIPQLQSEFREGKEYPAVVRVVRINDRLEDAFAVECCSGTHVLNTSSIFDFTILSDRSSAKGVRRIHALTGEKARQSKRYGREVLSLLMSESEKISLGQKTDVIKEKIEWTHLPYQDNIRCRELLKAIKKGRKLLKSSL